MRIGQEKGRLGLIGHRISETVQYQTKVAVDIVHRKLHKCVRLVQISIPRVSIVTNTNSIPASH